MYENIVEEDFSNDIHTPWEIVQPTLQDNIHTHSSLQEEFERYQVL